MKGICDTLMILVNVNDRMKYRSCINMIAWREKRKCHMISIIGMLRKVQEAVAANYYFIMYI